MSMGQTDKIRVMIDEKSIDETVLRLAEQINRDFAGQRLIVVGVLKGSFMFMSDLVKRITTDTEVYFLKASSYGAGKQTSGTVKITKDIERDIKGENVLIVEDIIDSGFTMHEVLRLLGEREPKCIRLCSCLSKPSRREIEVGIDYLGFEIPDEFVVGYGLDYAERYRNLPYIGVVEQ